MRINELAKRLHEANTDLDVIIYGRTKDIKAHMEMCSVRYKHEHIYSLKQTGEIPRYPNRNYGVTHPSGSFVRRMSVYELCKRLRSRGFIKTSDISHIMDL